MKAFSLFISIILSIYAFGETSKYYLYLIVFCKFVFHVRKTAFKPKNTTSLPRKDIS